MMDEAVTKDLMALLGPEPRPWVLHAVAWGIDSSMHEWFPMMWRNGLPNHRRWKLQSGDIYPVLEFREDDFGTRPNTTRHHNIEVKVTDLPHVRFWDRDDDIEVTFASRPPLTWIRPYYSWEEHGRYFSSHTALYRLWDRRHVRTKVMVGIETDRSLWVHALTAAGYQVYGINPLAVSRYRDRHNLAGAKSDQGDAKVLADLVRTDRHNHRPIAGDSPDVEGVRVLARAHQNLLWARTRHVNQLRNAFREYYPAALVAFDDLDDRDTLAVLERAPSPDIGVRLTVAQIRAALNRGGRQRSLDQRAKDIQAALRSEQSTAPSQVTAAFSATTKATVGVIAELNPSERSATASSGYSTAASNTRPSTTNTPPGHTANHRPLDKNQPWDVYFPIRQDGADTG